MMVPHVATKYKQFSLEQILKSEQLCNVLNKTLIDVWQYSEYPRIFEYAMVLSILGLHNVVNNIFYQIYLMPYSLSYKFDSFLRIPWALNMLGLEYT